MGLDLKIKASHVEINSVRYKDQVEVTLNEVDQSDIESQLPSILEDVSEQDILDNVSVQDVVTFFGEETLLEDMDKDRILGWLSDNGYNIEKEEDNEV